MAERRRRSSCYDLSHEYHARHHCRDLPTCDPGPAGEGGCRTGTEPSRASRRQGARWSSRRSACPKRIPQAHADRRRTAPSFAQRRAETLIQDAIEDKLCVDVAGHAFDRRQVAGDSPRAGVQGTVPAAAVLKDQQLYDGLIDAFSMRGFNTPEGDTGHDHAFTKFGGTDPSHTGEWLDE